MPFIDLHKQKVIAKQGSLKIDLCFMNLQQIKALHSIHFISRDESLSTTLFTLQYILVFRLFRLPFRKLVTLSSKKEEAIDVLQCISNSLLLVSSILFSWTSVDSYLK